MGGRYDPPMANPSQDPPLLAIEVTSADGRSKVSVAGELDAASAGELEAALTAEVSASTAVELDLGGVGFIDSSGLRALLVAQQAADDAGGSLVLVATTPAVDRLLELTGLNETFRRPV
jgi:anti-anti-sigma factor